MSSKLFDHRTPRSCLQVNEKGRISSFAKYADIVSTVCCASCVARKYMRSIESRAGFNSRSIDMRAKGGSVCACHLRLPDTSEHAWRKRATCL